MIVWLASYPRSGNTFLRVVLHNVYGVATYVRYDGTCKDIITGHHSPGRCTARGPLPGRARRLVHSAGRRPAPHQVEFFFACEIVGPDDTPADPDPGQDGVEWCSLVELRGRCFFPEPLLDAPVGIACRHGPRR